jgi:hypothetical protein
MSDPGLCSICDIKIDKDGNKGKAISQFGVWFCSPKCRAVRYALDKEKEVREINKPHYNFDFGGSPAF